MSGTSSSVTLPVVPSIAISPSASSTSPMRTTAASASTLTSEAPATHGRPIPRDERGVGRLAPER